MERQKNFNLAKEIPLLNVNLDRYHIQIESLEVLTGRNPKEIVEIRVNKVVSLRTVNQKGKTIAYKYEVSTDIGSINLTNTVSGDSWALDAFNLKE